MLVAEAGVGQHGREAQNLARYVRTLLGQIALNIELRKSYNLTVHLAEKGVPHARHQVARRPVLLLEAVVAGVGGAGQGARGRLAAEDEGEGGELQRGDGPARQRCHGLAVLVGEAGVGNY